MADDDMRALRRLVRKRFTGADALRYSHTAADPADTILWQVLRGDRVVWDAGPAVERQIPDWPDLAEAAVLLHKVVTAAGPAGDWLVQPLRDRRRCLRCGHPIERIGGAWVVVGTADAADGLSYCPPDPDADRVGNHVPARAGR
jgi:hypothetical protein